MTEFHDAQGMRVVRIRMRRKRIMGFTVQTFIVTDPGVRVKKRVIAETFLMRSQAEWAIRNRGWRELS